MHQELTKAFLEEVYIRQKLSTWAIEKEYGLTRSRVYAALKRYGIQTRSIAASHVRYNRENFSGDIHEKAYLIGFTIGDLRVRRHNKSHCETISIGCGSTKLAQVRLFEDLFSRYGRVWKGRPDARGAINMEAFVNLSFSFLLPNQRSYEWTLADESSFFAFLAGFTDAEGSFCIAQGQARIAWGNYDTGVLSFIRTGLSRYGIDPPKLYCDTLQGYIGSHGYPRNKNYCHVTCTKKRVVFTVLNKLDSFIRHSDKRAKMEMVRENITRRDAMYGE